MIACTGETHPAHACRLQPYTLRHLLLILCFFVFVLIGFACVRIFGLHDYNSIKGSLLGV